MNPRMPLDRSAIDFDERRLPPTAPQPQPNYQPEGDRLPEETIQSTLKK
jgi:hypothetical protein